VGLFKKDKEKKPPKDDGSDKSWGQIVSDMPKMPTTRGMAQGTANAASFMKNMANAGDTSRLRLTGLKGTVAIHKLHRHREQVGMNHAMELQLLVHVDGRPDWPVTHQESMAPIMVNGLANGSSSSATSTPTTRPTWSSTCRPSPGRGLQSARATSSRTTSRGSRSSRRPR
jgi:hypothetical protein